MSSQRETTVVWSRSTGQPIANAIVWQDTRTADACTRLAGGDPAGIDRFRATTGLPISTYSSALKLAWILDDGDTDVSMERRASMDEALRRAGIARWHKGVERSLGWVDPAQPATSL